MSWRSVVPARDEALAAVASAALFAVAFPPFRLWLPVFLCLVPLAAAVARTADTGGSSRSAARIGFWFGFLGYACNLYWIAIALSLYTKLAILGYVAALAWLAPFVALDAAALCVLRRRTRLPMAVLLPLAWVALEVILNYLADLAFPWLPLGLAMSRHPILAQLAELSGVRGVSFWIAATNGLLADAWLAYARRRKADASRGTRATGAVRAAAVRLAGAAVLGAAVAGYGAWRMSAIRMRIVAPIAVIQPNIPQEEKWQEENQDRIVGILASVTREHARRRDARLIVWPEVALPGYLSSHPDWGDTLRALGAEARVPLLFGVLDAEVRSQTDYDYYNAALLTDTLGRVGEQRPYRKEFLVPIVERVPFLNPRWFGSLKYFGGYGRGEDAVPFRLPFGDVGVLICYESIFPQLSRHYRREGAELLINITNDAWFGRSIAPYQHQAHLALRAIENRVGVVRSANTGISGYIDPLGRARGETPLFTRDARTYAAETTDIVTPYVRFGDWLGTACLLATALGVAAGGWRRRRRLG
ncbi:MAG: apolipoprotein N-acyltransferase [Gemmatimonadaceae bacterium]